MVEGKVAESINKGPGQHLELIKELPTSEERKKELAKAMTAFANTNDGIIYVGVDADTRRIVGFDQSRNFSEEILQIDRKYCKPPVMPEVAVEKIGQKQVGIINVRLGSSKPYCIDGDCYIRGDKKVYVASHGEIQSMYRKRSTFKSEKGDGWPVEGTTYENLDAKKIGDYIKKRKERLGEEVGGAKEKFLKNIGLLVEVKGRLVPTAGAMLMFGKQPQHFLSSSSVRVARFKGKDTGSVIIDQKEIVGTIPEMIDEAGQFIIKHMSTGAHIEGLKRSDTTEYPLVAVREAITNAIVHRDYTIEGSQVRIFMFDDRIEVYTPGGLPDGVTVDNIEHTQYSRNRIITETLMYIGQYMEKLGTGIRRIRLAVKQNELREPKFLDTGADFILTLFGPIDKEWQLKKHQRDGRIPELLAPAKSPQEIGRLPSRKRHEVARQTGKPHLSRGIQKFSFGAGHARKRLFKAIVVGVLGAGLIILIIGVRIYNNRRNNPSFQYQRAAMLHHNEKYYKAIDAYEAFVERFPSHKKADDAQYFMAACLEIVGKDIDALNAYGEVLRRYPKSSWKPYAHYWRGAIYLRLEQLENAIADYQEVIQYYPEHPVALSAMRDVALCFQKQRRFEEAIAMYEKLLGLKETSIDGYEHYQMALCYLELRQKEKAVESFREVVSNEKADPELIKKAEEEIRKLGF